jgi:hypothetical protein
MRTGWMYLDENTFIVRAYNFSAIPQSGQFCEISRARRNIPQSFHRVDKSPNFGQKPSFSV